MAARKAMGAAIAFFGLVCAALSITIIVLIADNLYPGSGWYQVYIPATGLWSEYFYLEGTCLMTNNGINVCRYGYSVGAIGILSSIALMFAMCAPAIISLLMAGFNTIWFLAFAITATVYDHNIDGDDGIPERTREYNDKYRTDVYALAWTCFAVSLLCIPLALAMMKSHDSKGADVEEKRVPEPEAVRVVHEAKPTDELPVV